MKLAFEDARAVVHDGPLPDDLFDDERLARRRSLVRPDAARDASFTLPRGGTTYLCAVDGNGMAISLIQSLYGWFGSGVVAPGTGVVLQNRAAGFSLDPEHPNALGPSKRPFHTIIPGMLLEHGVAARAVRRHGRPDAAPGPLPGRAAARRRGRRPAGRSRCPSLPRLGGRPRRARAGARGPCRRSPCPRPRRPHGAVAARVRRRAGDPATRRSLDRRLGRPRRRVRRGQSDPGRGDIVPAAVPTRVLIVDDHAVVRTGCVSCSTARRTSRSSARRATATPESAPRASRSRTSSSSTSSCPAARGSRSAPRS